MDRNEIGETDRLTEELPYIVGTKLIERGITISACESCTGGLFSGAITDIPGISKVFNRGLVTYTYEAKEDELGVSRDTLAEFTAESREVAIEMVEGLKRKTNSDICISVTGLTGPGGGTEAKPVGTVFIGCIFGRDTFVRTLNLKDKGRRENRHRVVLEMFDMINKIIK